MSIPSTFHLSNPSLTSPVTLQSQPGPAAETAYQVSNGEYFFQLASGGSSSNNFVGPVTIDDPAASLTVNGTVGIKTPVVASLQGDGLTVHADEDLSVNAAVNLDVNAVNGALTMEGRTGVGITGTNANAVVAIQGGSVNLTSTYIAGGLNLLSSSGISIQAPESIGIAVTAGNIDIYASNPGNIELGNPNTGAGTIQLTGSTVKFVQNSAATPPIEVQYGIGGTTGYLYDSNTNRILSTATSPVASYNQAFTTLYDSGFTPTVSGFYLITQIMTFGTSISYAPNAYVTSFLTLTNGSLGTPLVNSQVVFTMTFDATSGAPVAQTYQNFVFLTAGQTVYSDIGVVGTVNLGAGGGLTITAQPFGCFF